jgi:Holliday junction resolvase-like predicted endonuclease
MSSQGRASIRFTLNGQRYELGREDVESRLADVAPDAIRKHAVRVNGTWFPAIQAFEVATGIPRSEFISHTARRHLAALGFEVAGDIESRTSSTAVGPAVTPPSAPLPAAGLRPYVSAPAEHGGEWHTEANVQAALVTALAGEGWRILSVANTATKEHGIDVIASRDGQTAGVEVKGYPSRGYADPARAGEVKRTSPSTQAGHWYSQAVLAAMRLRGKEPQWRSVIALPDFPRYRDLHAETAGSLAAVQIEVWWVDQAGAVQRP